MSTINEVPININDPSVKIRTVLEAIELVLLFNWNTRMERWHMSIMDATETPLLMAIPMHINTELIQRFDIAGMPPGQFFLFDTTGRGEEATVDELGDRFRLYYNTSE